MPRPRKDFIRLTGRVIAEGGSTKEEVEFVRKKLKVMDQASLIRQAISVLYKYENGEILGSSLDQFTEKIISEILNALKGMDFKEVSEILSSQKNDDSESDPKKEELSRKEQELKKKIKKIANMGFGFLKDE